MNRLRLGTRGSPLAQAQTEQIVQNLESAFPEISFETVIIRSEGDNNFGSLLTIGGQGVFTAALSEALINQEIDCAVHSLKDLPTITKPQLTLGAISKREDARDVLVSKQTLDQLPSQARIGTGSMRRRAQILKLRPDLKMVDIRGNVETRLKKIASGEVDGIILAIAGLKRLGLLDESEHLEGFKIQTFSVEEFTPAVGQGAIGLECRSGDERTLKIIASLNDSITKLAVETERRLLAQLGSGCQIPFGAHAQGDQCHLMLASEELNCHHRHGKLDDAQNLFEDLLASVSP